MREQKLVTQVLCYYNEEKYLRESIASILNQSYSNLELILVDDGSMDRSRNIAKEFCDDRIVHVFNEENHGPAWCRNQGLALARGEYIGFLDADDIAKKDKIEKMACYLDSHEDVLVVSGGYVFIDKFGRCLSQKVGVICDDLDIRAFMLFGNCVASAALFRRIIVDKYHIQQNAKMRTSQDYFFWHECLNYGRFHNLNEPLYCYRIGHNSQCNRSRKRDPKQYEEILQKIFRYAWKKRGFYLNRNEIEYIYKHFYKNECIQTITEWGKGYRLYNKIKKQAEKLKLDEGQKILEIYRNYMKNHIVADIKVMMHTLFNF